MVRAASPPNAIVADAPFLAPTEEQIRILVELVWGFGGGSIADFTRRCKTAREQGGAGLPEQRCSRDVARKLLIAAAEVEFQVDRDEIIPAASEIAWAQDKAGYGPMLQKYRVVQDDFVVRCRMVDLFTPAEGDTAVHECLDMRRGLEKLCSVPSRADHPRRGTATGSSEACAAASPHGEEARPDETCNGHTTEASAPAERSTWIPGWLQMERVAARASLPARALMPRRSVH